MAGKFAAVFIALAAVAALVVEADPSDSRSIYHHQDTAKMAYDFGYEHADAHTGNKQGRKETRDGYGNVRGSYNLVEPDGSYRVVEYTADKHNGFIANVKDKHGVRTYGQPGGGYGHGGSGQHHQGGHQNGGQHAGAY